MADVMTKVERFLDTSMSPELQILLRMGDDALVLGQRLVAWNGHAPSLELDIAMSNLSLDAIGQARHWLTLAGEREGNGRTEDDFAYWRDPQAFTNLLLVEQPNGDFAVTMLRQFMFSAYQHLLYQDLARSNDSSVADLASGGGVEVDYHLRFAEDWVRRLGLGTEESHKRMQGAVDRLWRYSAEIGDRDEIVIACTSSGFAPVRETLAVDWAKIVVPVLEECALTLPDIGKATFYRGGRVGRHTEHIAPLLAEMQSLARQFPGVKW